MALGFAATAEITAPVEVSSCARTHSPLVPVTDSKPSRVPLPDSRPTQEIARSSPPSSLQFLISPLKMDAICSMVRSSTGQSLFTMIAMPSSATTVPVRPVSLVLSAREARPISQLPVRADSMPVPEPVGS